MHYTELKAFQVSPCDLQNILCSIAWSQYMLRDGENWSTSGSLNYNTTLQLNLLCKKRDEFPYVLVWPYIRTQSFKKNIYSSSLRKYQSLTLLPRTFLISSLTLLLLLCPFRLPSYIPIWAPPYQHHPSEPSQARTNCRTNYQ